MFPIPCDVTTVWQFIGLASYYGCFVPNFSTVAAPLCTLTKKNSVFKWTPKRQLAFNHLKGMLVTLHILPYPKFGPEAEFVWEMDASGIGLGAVLSQLQEDSELHPIAYASGCLDTSKRNHRITELETLAVVWTVRYFWPYLLGHCAIVFTDHSACVSVLSSA